MDIIGVTGTNGKTTCTYYIAHLLGGRRVGIIGTLGAFVGRKRIEYSGAQLTTPDAMELKEIFSKMEKLRVRTVVMEVSAHGIAQNRLEGLTFRVGVLTNITHDHLDYFETFERYEKTKLDWINGDTVIKKIFSPECGENFSEQNRQTAIAVAKVFGISDRKIAKRLKTLPDVAGRFERIENIIIDYAHTPDGLEKVLRMAKVLGERLIVVFGCGGNRDVSKRPKMGKIASDLADKIIITSDNPRDEDPNEIIAQIKSGVDSDVIECHTIENRVSAIHFAIDLSMPKDVVVIAGKGAETTQEIEGIKYPYSDRETVKQYLHMKKNPTRIKRGGK